MIFKCNHICFMKCNVYLLTPFGSKFVHGVTSCLCKSKHIRQNFSELISLTFLVCPLDTFFRRLCQAVCPYLFLFLFRWLPIHFVCIVLYCIDCVLVILHHTPLHLVIPLTDSVNCRRLYQYHTVRRPLYLERPLPIRILVSYITFNSRLKTYQFPL